VFFFSRELTASALKKDNNETRYFECYTAVLCIQQGKTFKRDFGVTMYCLMPDLDRLFFNEPCSFMFGKNIYIVII